MYNFGKGKWKKKQHRESHCFLFQRNANLSFIERVSAWYAELFMPMIRPMIGLGIPWLTNFAYNSTNEAQNVLDCLGWGRALPLFCYLKTYELRYCSSLVSYKIPGIFQAETHRFRYFCCLGSLISFHRAKNFEILQGKVTQKSEKEVQKHVSHNQLLGRIYVIRIYESKTR